MSAQRRRADAAGRTLPLVYVGGRLFDLWTKVTLW
jgi:hypothetical protein